MLTVKVMTTLEVKERKAALGKEKGKVEGKNTVLDCWQFFFINFVLFLFQLVPGLVSVFL